MLKSCGLILLLIAGAQCGVRTANGTIDSEEAGQIDGQATTNCSCGYTYQSSGRIVGGVETGVNEYPYMAMLVMRTLTGWSPFCGGSIITPYHVITAAHCTFGQTALNMAVVVGEHNFTSTSESTYTKLYTLSSVFQHELYNPVNTLNDISILVTLRKIQFSEAVGPVCMPAVKRDLVGQYLRVTGWGTLSYQGDQSKVLMKVDLRVVPLTDCSAVYSVNASNPTQVCTYTTGKDSCQGDSGGPLAWLNPDTNRFDLTGLVSYGYECAADGYPGVNTDVYAFTSWIQTKLTQSALLTGLVRQRTCSAV